MLSFVGVEILVEQLAVWGNFGCDWGSELRRDKRSSTNPIFYFFSSLICALTLETRVTAENSLTRSSHTIFAADNHWWNNAKFQSRVDLLGILTCILPTPRSCSSSKRPELSCSDLNRWWNEATVKGFYKSIFAAAASWRSLFLRTHSPSLSSKSGLIWRLTGGGVFTSIYTNLISSKQSDFWVWVTAGTKLFTMVFGGWNHPQHDIYSLKSVWGLVHMTWTVIRYVQCLNSLKSPEAHTQSKVSFVLYNIHKALTSTVYKVRSL